MKINRKKFFDAIRKSPFDGLKQSQVDGINMILDEWEKRKLTDWRWLANMLAQSKIETAHTMQPVREKDNKARTYLRSKKYWPWVGRGHIQITWERNYKKFQPIILGAFGMDIIADPDVILRYPRVSIFIMFEGMIHGLFTGKKFADYFNDKKTDWVNARRIVNGLDRAEEIALISKEFHSDIISSLE